MEICDVRSKLLKKRNDWLINITGGVTRICIKNKKNSIKACCKFWVKLLNSLQIKRFGWLGWCVF